MYPNYRMNRAFRPNYQSDDRFGFVFPFLLGGVTGAAIAPNFYRPNYQPYYPPYYRPYGPYFR